MARAKADFQRSKVIDGEYVYDTRYFEKRYEVHIEGTLLNLINFCRANSIPNLARKGMVIDMTYWEGWGSNGLLVAPGTILINGKLRDYQEFEQRLIFPFHRDTLVMINLMPKETNWVLAIDKDRTLEIKRQKLREEKKELKSIANRKKYLHKKRMIEAGMVSRKDEDGRLYWI